MYFVEEQQINSAIRCEIEKFRITQIKHTMKTSTKEYSAIRRN